VVTMGITYVGRPAVVSHIASRRRSDIISVLAHVLMNPNLLTGMLSN